MNNNQKRRLERRRRARGARGQSRPDPLSVPPPPGTLCVVCSIRSAETKGEIGVAGGESLVFSACKPCAAAAPGLIGRIGFKGYRELIRRNVRNAVNDG